MNQRIIFSKTLYLFFFFVLSFLLTVSAAEKTFPQACQINCKSQYGEVLGKTAGNVEAYSNCNADCVVFHPNKLNGTYTGIKWQCVEFARRWLLVKQGVVYGDVDIAADIWKLESVTRPKDGKSIKFSSFPNGSTTAPKIGDLIIYGDEYLNTGHVAVVVSIDKNKGSIAVAEQNYHNKPWPGNYARHISYHVQNGKHWILDSYLIGWKRVDHMALNQFH